MRIIKRIKKRKTPNPLARFKQKAKRTAMVAGIGFAAGFAIGQRELHHESTGKKTLPRPVASQPATQPVVQRGKTQRVLMRPRIVSGLPVWRQKTDAYQKLIVQHNQCKRLSTRMVQRIIFIESSGRPKVQSKVNAKGLMGIRRIAMDELVRVKRIPKRKYDLTQPKTNIFIGTRYLDYLFDILTWQGSRQKFRALPFDRQLDLVLAAYNTGPTKVKKNGITPAGRRYINRFRGLP